MVHCGLLPASRLRTQKKENDHTGRTFSVWVRTLPKRGCDCLGKIPSTYVKLDNR